MQEARGASLTPPGETHTSPTARHRFRWIFAAVALVAFVADQLAKEWALVALEDRSIPVLGDWFSFHLVFNPGAAFGTGTRYTWVFSCLALVAMAVVLWLSRRLGSPLWSLGLGLLLGGVAGNFADRLFRAPGPMHGHVIDFLMLPNWPVFNIADVCINVAAGVIILQTFRGINVDGTRDRAETQATEPDVPGERATEEEES